jgi:hypothetical protein
MSSFTLRTSTDTDPLQELIEQYLDEIRECKLRMDPYQQHITRNQTLIARLRAAGVLPAPNENSAVTSNP